MSMTVLQGESRVREFCAQYRLRDKLQFKVRLTQEEAFDGYKDIARFPGKFLGAYFPAGGYAAFATANIRDDAEFDRSLRHEVIGHLGINTFNPGRKGALLNALIAARDQPRLSKLWCKVEGLYPGVAPAFLAEEVFATACEDVRPGERTQMVEVARCFEEACMSGDRLLTAFDLKRITIAVAQGLAERSLEIQNQPADDFSQFAPGYEIVATGEHHGKVISVMHGLVTQKVNRDGATVRHLAACLDRSVAVDDLMGVQYNRDGKGVVQVPDKDLSLGL